MKNIHIHILHFFRLYHVFINLNFQKYFIIASSKFKLNKRFFFKKKKKKKKKSLSLKL